MMRMRRAVAALVMALLLMQIAARPAMTGYSTSRLADSCLGGCPHAQHRSPLGEGILPPPVLHVQAWQVGPRGITWIPPKPIIT